MNSNEHTQAVKIYMMKYRLLLFFFFGCAIERLLTTDSECAACI